MAPTRRRATCWRSSRPASGIALTVLGLGGSEQVQIASIPGYGDREVLMASGVSFPADPIEASAGGDWLYGLV